MLSAVHRQGVERAQFGRKTMRLAATLWLATAGISAAETAQEFHLCASYVQQSATGQQVNGVWPVFVKLTERGAQSFEAFTEANTGKLARVVVDGREFSRATIRAPIAGGNLQGTFSLQAKAIEWERILAAELPLEPCGVRGEMPKQKGS